MSHAPGGRFDLAVGDSTVALGGGIGEMVAP